MVSIIIIFINDRHNSDTVSIIEENNRHSSYYVIIYRSLIQLYYNNRTFKNTDTSMDL